ncbi:MAG: hypothetical protein ACPGR8_13515 [Limisphaerales bacterium]
MELPTCATVAAIDPVQLLTDHGKFVDNVPRAVQVAFCSLLDGCGTFAELFEDVEYDIEWSDMRSSIVVRPPGDNGRQRASEAIVYDQFEMAELMTEPVRAAMVALMIGAKMDDVESTMLEYELAWNTTHAERPLIPTDHTPALLGCLGTLSMPRWTKDKCVVCDWASVPLHLCVEPKPTPPALRRGDLHEAVALVRAECPGVLPAATEPWGPDVDDPTEAGVACAVALLCSQHWHFPDTYNADALSAHLKRLADRYRPRQRLRRA